MKSSYNLSKQYKNVLKCQETKIWVENFKFWQKFRKGEGICDRSILIFLYLCEISHPQKWLLDGISVLKMLDTIPPLFQQFWSFMLPTHTSRNIQQSTGHTRRPKWRWLSRFLVFEPQQESIGSILGHTAWASNLFVTQIISRCPHLKRCESHSWTLKLFHLKYLRGPAVFRHSSTKHTLQCVVSGQTPEIAFSRPLGFAFGLWAPIAAIAPSMPMCHPMYK
jgi:hypothetical protein